jgi:hypothetical protein
MSQYFSIQLSSIFSGYTFVLTQIPSNSGGAGPYLMLWSQFPPTAMAAPPVGQNFASQQWTISWDGYISSAADPTQYLTLGTYADGVVTSAPPQAGATSIVTLAAFDEGLVQQWVVLPGGDKTAAIATKQSYDQYLAANGVNPPPVQVLSTWGQQVNDNVWLTVVGAAFPDPGLGGTQQWDVVPCETVVDQWTTIRSLQSPDGEALLVSLPMKVSGNLKPGNSLNIMPTGTQAVVASHAGFGNGSTWQLTADGCLMNAWNSDLVLTAGIDPDGDLDGTVWVFPLLSSPPPPNQAWVVPERGVLVSQATLAGRAVRALTATIQNGVAQAGAQLTMAPYTAGSPAPGQQWELFPGLALQTLLVQPRIPFPTEGATYTYIEQQLWPTQTIDIPGGGSRTVGGVPKGGLRAQYTNLAAPLGSFQSQILVMPSPTSGGSATYPDWDKVVAQLVAELTAAQAVQNLFQQMSLMAVELVQAQSLILNDIAAELAIAPATTLKAKVKWWQFAMGVIYSVLNVAAGIATLGESSALKTLASTGISAVANLLQTAFNSTQLKSQQQQPKDAGIATYAQLEASLLLAFEQMETELATIEELVLTDWRKLQIFYGMCLQPSGMDSLFWPSKATPAQARKMLPGYIEQVLKALVPTTSNDWIDSYSFNTGTATPGLSVDLGSGTPMTYVTVNTPVVAHSNGSTINTYNKYEASWPSRLAEYFLESQANPNNFFRGIDGWQILCKEQNATNGLCTVLILNATNLPSDELSLRFNGQGIDGQSQSTFEEYVAQIGPYGAVLADVEGKPSDDCSLVVNFMLSGQTTGGNATFQTNGTSSISQPTAGEFAITVAAYQPSYQNWGFVVTFGYA